MVKKIFTMIVLVMLQNGGFAFFQRNLHNLHQSPQAIFSGSHRDHRESDLMVPFKSEIWLKLGSHDEIYSVRD